jgi:hypothetical protein
MIRRTFLALLTTLASTFADSPEKKEMKPDVLYIEDPDEEMMEEFAISAGTWNLRQDTDGTWEFTIKVETSKALKRSKERQESFNGAPHFEITAILSAKDATITKGKIISQKESYDRKRDINLSWFYYSGGGGLEKLRLEVLEEKEGIIDVKLTGYYDGLQSKVALKAKLKKDPKLKRGVQ